MIVPDFYTIFHYNVQQGAGPALSQAKVHPPLL